MICKRRRGEGREKKGAEVVGGYCRGDKTRGCMDGYLAPMYRYPEAAVFGRGWTEQVR